MTELEILKGKIEEEKIDLIFEKHSSHFLNRCFPDWIK